MLPTKEARVTATASLALFDVRTGYIYGLAESTAQENRIASTWTRAVAVEDAREKAERLAFTQMLGDFDKTWKGIMEEYASSGTKAAVRPLH